MVAILAGEGKVKGQSTRIPVEKGLVLRLYCYSRQAERSVHRALDAKWLDFKNYYGWARISPIKLLVERLYGFLGTGSKDLPPLSQEEIGSSLPTVGIIRYYFGGWIARRKKRWSFPASELHFMGSTLNSLVILLELPAKPDPAVLLSLRRDFCACESIIDGRCHGLPEIKRAKTIEHFQRPDWLPTVTLAEILDKQPEELSGALQSA